MHGGHMGRLRAAPEPDRAGHGGPARGRQSAEPPDASAAEGSGRIGHGHLPHASRKAAQRHVPVPRQRVGCLPEALHT